MLRIVIENDENSPCYIFRSYVVSVDGNFRNTIILWFVGEGDILFDPTGVAFWHHFFIWRSNGWQPNFDLLRWYDEFNGIMLNNHSCIGLWGTNINIGWQYWNISWSIRWDIWCFVFQIFCSFLCRIWIITNKQQEVI